MSKLKIKPLADIVVARTEEAASMTTSGLYIPDKSGEKPATAIIEAVGPKVKDVKVGDRIVYASYSGTDVKLDDQDYVFLNEEKVLGVIV